jgi:hypothetical protein
MQKRGVLLGVLFVALTMFGFGTGCGGKGEADVKDSQTLLKDTFGPGHPIKSGRIALSLRITGSGGGFDSPVNLNLSGPFVASDKDNLPRFSVETKVGDGEQASVGLISTGKQGFITIGDQAFSLAADTYKDLQDSYAKTQAEGREQSKDATTLSALGVRPERWLTDVTSSSDSDVGGTPTIRVSGALNADGLLDDIDRVLARSGTVSGAAGAELPEGLEPKVQEALTRAIKTAKVSIEAGKEDRTLRRITLRLVLEVPADDQKVLGGLKNLDVDLDLAISELGEQQTIDAPKDAKPIDELTGALGALTQGRQAPQTTTTPAPQGSQQQYRDCLTNAGDDVAAIQQCASLIAP